MKKTKTNANQSVLSTTQPVHEFHDFWILKAVLVLKALESSAAAQNRVKIILKSG